jgi:glutamine amidotransferase
MAAAVARFEALSRRHGTTPHMRLSAALSDGQAIWAFRYATDDQAPSLFYRRDARAGGYAVVSEPLEEAEGWTSVPPGTVCRFDGEGVTFAPFAPAQESVPVQVAM